MYIKPEFNSIFLNLTDACNLRCRYCFVEKHPHFMELQTAIDAIELLVSIRRETKSKQISQIQLFGGEPTLMWDKVIVPLIEYCKKKNYLNNDVKFGITTNGILLNETMMDFLQENQISLLFSIDGTKETQDFNRPCVDPNKSSFDILEPKIAEIAHRFHPTFRGTLLPETCHNLYNNILFASKFEFTNCFFIPDWSNKGWTEEKIQVMKDEVHKYSKYFIDCYRRGKEPLELSSYTRRFSAMQNYLNYKNKGVLNKRNTGFCGLGLKSAGISWNGDIYACQELPSLGRDSIYYIGDIYNGIDKERRDVVVNTYLNGIPTCEGNSEVCDNCIFKSNCMNNTCHASCFMRCGDMNSRSKIECIWDQYTLEECLMVSKILINNGCQEFINKYKLQNIKLD